MYLGWGLTLQVSGVRSAARHLRAIGCQLSAVRRPKSCQPQIAIRHSPDPEKGKTSRASSGESRMAKSEKPLCFQDFTCNPHGLKILRSIPKTERLFSRFYGVPPGGGHTPFAVRYSPDAENKPKHSASSPANGDQEQISRPTDGLVMTNPKGGAFIHP